MNAKDLAALAAVVLLVWHGLSLIKDAERYKQNLVRFNAKPTWPNFVRLAVAEGVLIGDLRWL